jgi:hypothetical protein
MGSAKFFRPSLDFHRVSLLGAQQEHRNAHAVLNPACGRAEEYVRKKPMPMGAQA